MCRIALINKEGLNYIEENFGVLKYLDSLEKSCGGHGNGFLLIRDGKIVFKAKGLAMTNESIVMYANKVEFDWLIYHTRVASAGSTKDENCHPYWNSTSTFALAMNGTVRDVGNLAKDLDITDTDLIYRMINKRIIDVEAVRHVGPNFIGFKDNKVWACNNGYSTGGLKYIDKDGVIAIASEFPNEFIKDYETMDEYFWWEGEELKKKVYSVSTTPYTYGNYGWSGIIRTYNEPKNEVENSLAIVNLKEAKKIANFDYTLKDIKRSVERAIKYLKKNCTEVNVDNIYDCLFDNYDYTFSVKEYGICCFDITEDTLYLMSDWGEVVAELYINEDIKSITN